MADGQMVRGIEDTAFARGYHLIAGNSDADARHVQGLLATIADPSRRGPGDLSTTIFRTHDMVAIGAIRAIYDAGLDIPRAIDRALFGSARRGERRQAVRETVSQFAAAVTS